MMIVAVANLKGGSGKSTLASALGVHAAGEKIGGRVKRVALVDFDPQRSLVDWWNRRGETDNPKAYVGADTTQDAIEKLEQVEAPDVVILDGPPAFMMLVQDMIEHADLALIPVKPSMLDLPATLDALVLAYEAGTPVLCVINDFGANEKKLAAATREALAVMEADIDGKRVKLNPPIAETAIRHRMAHITAMTVGKSAAEVNGGRDKEAAKDIADLWEEVKAAATKAIKARARRRAG
jgi:chromosome partitioning protein